MCCVRSWVCCLVLTSSLSALRWTLRTEQRNDWSSSQTSHQHKLLSEKDSGKCYRVSCLNSAGYCLKFDCCGCTPSPCTAQPAYVSTVPSFSSGCLICDTSVLEHNCISVQLNDELFSTWNILHERRHSSVCYYIMAGHSVALGQATAGGGGTLRSTLFHL